MASFLGVDVGGTKVAVAAVEGNDARHAVEHPTPLESTEALLDGIEAAVREVAAEAGEPDAIGIGVPSQVELATGTVVASVNIPLAGVAAARGARPPASACRSSSTTTRAAPRSPRRTRSAPASS